MNFLEIIEEISNFDFLILWHFWWCWTWDRSSLEEDNDKTTYGAFVDIDPRQPVSLRALVIKSPLHTYFLYVTISGNVKKARKPPRKIYEIA